jgi:hypothetical protein
MINFKYEISTTIWLGHRTTFYDAIILSKIQEQASIMRTIPLPTRWEVLNQIRTNIYYDLNKDVS